MFDPELGIDFARLVHGEQAFRWHRLVVAGDELTTTLTVADISRRWGICFYAFATESVDAARRGRLHRHVDQHRQAAAVKPGDEIELTVTPDRYVTVRYAGASGDFNPIHIDEEFARQVGLPGRILHGLWTMAQVARAHTEAFGGPESLAEPVGPVPRNGRDGAGDHGPRDGRPSSSPSWPW